MISRELTHYRHVRFFFSFDCLNKENNCMQSIRFRLDDYEVVCFNLLHVNGSFQFHFHFLEM